MAHAEESRDPSDWFEKGRKDRERVERCLRDEDFEDAAFHLQQALEKYLKGYLLSRGWPLQRTHNLAVLLDEALAQRPDFERFRPLCQEVTVYYVMERYPLLGEGPSREDIEAGLHQADELITLILKEAQLSSNSRRKEVGR